MAGAALVVGCASPTPPSVRPSVANPSPIGPPTTSPGARLTIRAEGLVGCDWMLGCGAFVDIDPDADPAAPLPEGWRPVHPTMLASDIVPEAAMTFTIGPPLTDPGTLAPGTYRVVAAWYLVDDVISPEPTTPDISSVPHTCVTMLEVQPDDREATISTTFALDGSCAVAAAAG